MGIEGKRSIPSTRENKKEQDEPKFVLFFFGELDENEVELSISSSEMLSSLPLVLYIILIWSS